MKTKEERLFKVFSLNGSMLGVKVKDGQVFVGNEGGPIAGSKAVVEEAGQISSRYTATRILALGVFALAFKKKKDNRDLFLAIEGPGYLIGVAVKPKDEAKARSWARELNSYAVNGIIK